jgi:5'-nucleotidase
MAFLLSNDDGAHAPGLAQLAQSLKEANYDCHVIAPDRDRSGVSNSLTLDRPLHPVHLGNGFIAINGTPTDCVHLGLNALYRDDEYDIERVIAGINSGANLGDDVIYSGTVAAAMEGRFLNKAPIAISLVGKKNFITAAKVLIDLLPKIETLVLPERTIININVPDVPYEQLKGIEITRLGHRARSDNPVLTTNPRGKECYWISAAGEGADAGEGTDFYAIEQGKVSITPIQADMTHRNALECLAQLASR